MASVPIKAEVQKLFKPYEAAFVRFVLEAWAQWWKNPDRADMGFMRTRATVIHNFIMNRAIPEMEAWRGVDVKKRCETAAFVLANARLVARVKKGNQDGLCSNAETNASLLFEDPQESLEGLDLPDVWKVDVAYVLNTLATKIEKILVVARDRDAIIWDFEIYSAEAAGAPVPTLPVSPRDPASPSDVLRVPGADRDQNKKKEGE